MVALRPGRAAMTTTGGEIDRLLDLVGDEHHGALLLAPGLEQLVLQLHAREP